MTERSEVTRPDRVTLTELDASIARVQNSQAWFSDPTARLLMRRLLTNASRRHLDALLAHLATPKGTSP